MHRYQTSAEIIKLKMGQREQTRCSPHTRFHSPDTHLS